MSVAVDLADLRVKVGEYGDAYVLTVSEDLRPHVVSTHPVWEGDELLLSVGRRSRSNAAARPSITLCFPPTEPGGFSLIVDGASSVGEEIIRFTPTAAVLHRPPPTNA